jgi:hypothetical protein
VAAKIDPVAKTELSALKSLRHAERQSKIFQKIGRTLKSHTTSGLSRVDIPNDKLEYVNGNTQTDSSNRLRPISENPPALRAILQRTIRTKRKDGPEEWVTVLDQSQIEQSILRYCQEHYQQAQPTPFGHGYLARLLGHSGLTAASQQILYGSFIPAHFDPSQFTELATFISELAMPAELRELEPLSQDITVADWKRALASGRNPRQHHHPGETSAYIRHFYLVGLSPQICARF